MRSVQLIGRILFGKGIDLILGRFRMRGTLNVSFSGKVLQNLRTPNVREGSLSMVHRSRLDRPLCTLDSRVGQQPAQIFELN